MASKSFNYTRAQSTNNIGCLILCEVALGKINNRINPDYSITKKSLSKKGYHSTKGIGRWGSTESSSHDGVDIPNGPVKELKKNTYLKYNEYVVYDVNQILIKYLVLVKNIGGHGGY